MASRPVPAAEPPPGASPLPLPPKKPAVNFMARAHVCVHVVVVIVGGCSMAVLEGKLRGDMPRRNLPAIPRAPSDSVK